MAGVPVYLASISRRSSQTGRTIPTPLWSTQTMADSWALLRRVLGPAGDASRERIFRMQVTTCLHRALRPEEVRALPPYFHTAAPTDLAGGPVEILFETEEGLASTRPCQHPTRHALEPDRPLMWIPLDCGACGPCLARAGLDAELDATGRTPLYLGDLKPPGELRG